MPYLPIDYHLWKGAMTLRDRFLNLFKNTAKPIDTTVLSLGQLDREVFARFYSAEFSMDEIPAMADSIEVYIDLMKHFVSRDRAHLVIEAYHYAGEVRIVSLQRFLQTADGRILNLRETCDSFQEAAREFLLQWVVTEHDAHVRNRMVASRFLMSVRTIVEFLTILQDRIRPGKNTRR